MAKGPAASKTRKTATIGSRHGRLWRFVPLAVIVAGLALGYAMGWHDYLSLALSRRQPRDAEAASSPAIRVLAPAGFVVLYAVAVAFSFPGRLDADHLRRLPVRLAGRRRCCAVVAATARRDARCFSPRARPSAAFCKERAGGCAAKLADGFEKDAFGYLLVLRLAPFIPFFVVNIAPALFNVRLQHLRRRDAHRHPARRIRLCLAWPGRRQRARRGRRRPGAMSTVSDLVTPEITIAFVALALVAALADDCKEGLGAAMNPDPRQRLPPAVWQGHFMTNY